MKKPIFCHFCGEKLIWNNGEYGYDQYNGKRLDRWTCPTGKEWHFGNEPNEEPIFRASNILLRKRSKRCWYRYLTQSQF